MCRVIKHSIKFYFFLRRRRRRPSRLLFIIFAIPPVKCCKMKMKMKFHVRLCVQLFYEGNDAATKFRSLIFVLFWSFEATMRFDRADNTAVQRMTNCPKRKLHFIMCELSYTDFPLLLLLLASCCWCHCYCLPTSSYVVSHVYASLGCHTFISCCIHMIMIYRWKSTLLMIIVMMTSDEEHSRIINVLNRLYLYSIWINLCVQINHLRRYK